MNPILKRMLIAGIAAFILMIVLATPEVITQLLVFSLAFVVILGALYVAEKIVTKR